MIDFLDVGLVVVGYALGYGVRALTDGWQATDQVVARNGPLHGGQNYMAPPPAPNAPPPRTPQRQVLLIVRDERRR